MNLENILNQLKNFLTQIKNTPRKTFFLPAEQKNGNTNTSFFYYKSH